MGIADLKAHLSDVRGMTDLRHRNGGGCRFQGDGSVAAMNSRRFIRSSSQLEERRAKYQVSMVVALSRCANAASQTRRVAQDS